MREDIQHFWELLWAMTEKELKVRYKNTTLGFLWAIIYPIIQAFIIGFIFQFFYKNQSTYYNYSLFLNLLIWNFFSQTLSQATSSIIHQRDIVKKAKFPIITIPLSIVVCNVLYFITGLFLFTMFMVLTGIIHTIHIFFLAFGFLFLTLFTIGISLITSSLNVKIRDINFLTQAVIMIWFYATPIVYSFSIIPSNLKYLWSINPLTFIIDLFQHSFLSQPFSSPFILICNGICIIYIFIFGIWLFKKKEKYFDDFL